MENDSKDLTKQVLWEWESSSEGVKIISKDYKLPTIPAPTSKNVIPSTSYYRIEKMATYRNLYLEYISTLSEIDLVIVIDIDILDFEPGAIVSTLSKAPKDWGGLFSFGYTNLKIFNIKFENLYHDLFALKIEEPRDNTYLTFQEMFGNSKLISKRLKRSSYVPVISSFGGIGLYKYEAIKGLRYSSLLNDDELMEGVCEHIPFNYQIFKNGYKNYISRALLVYYGESNKLMVLRNLLPLKVFKLLAFLFTFKRLRA
ncbi:hypothetical protein [Desertivirga arenae]|uniref:hypothetical protein n=1 Tax=Desertivirga arenae TaxID=2810309 RepID=UPI001A970927|nr:hypothetical protein [Pedobacter sp. SYSU D00823]